MNKSAAEALNVNENYARLFMLVFAFYNNLSTPNLIRSLVDDCCCHGDVLLPVLAAFVVVVYHGVFAPL